MSARAIPLDPATILSAYAEGYFPMGDRNGRIGWYTCDPRGILPLDTFHVSDTLRVLIRKSPAEGGFEIRINHDFEAAMRACSESRNEGTWITQPLIDAYVRLHRLGAAHSVEAWKDGQLAGGLYGVSLGAAFFGESMFHRVRDASKVALVALVARLRQRGYRLLDTQTMTDHLRRFGGVQIPVPEYLGRLKAALREKCDFNSPDRGLDLSPGTLYSGRPD